MLFSFSPSFANRPVSDETLNKGRAPSKKKTRIIGLIFLSNTKTIVFCNLSQKEQSFEFPTFIFFLF